MQKRKVPSPAFNDSKHQLDVEKQSSKTIALEDERLEKMEEKGVKAVGVIGFNEIGPYLDTCTPPEASSLLSKMTEDSSLVTELTIIGKHTTEFRTKEGEKVLIRSVGDSGSYVLVERSGRKKRKPRKLLEKIVKEIRDKQEENETKKLQKTLERFAE